MVALTIGDGNVDCHFANSLPSVGCYSDHEKSVTTAGVTSHCHSVRSVTVVTFGNSRVWLVKVWSDVCGLACITGKDEV
jgi:hypothetical protein